MTKRNNGHALIWTNIRVTLGKLKPWADNPRLSTKAQAERILESFKVFGQVQTIAISPAFEVYDGHQRLSALLTLHGESYEVDARQASRALTDTERRRLVLALHAGAVGSWNWDSLAGWDDVLLRSAFDTDALDELNRDAAAVRMLIDGMQEIPVFKEYDESAAEDVEFLTCPHCGKAAPKIADYPAHLESCWREHLAPRADDAPAVISTFAGCGGSSLGYSMAGFRELLAVEWDDNAVDTFKLNFPGVPVYHGDIAKLSVEQALEMTGLEPGQLDIFDGSPPCQGFSAAGKRQFYDGRNQLFREYVRLLRGLMPRVFVMENVSGMVKGKMKLIFSDILRELKASGYRVSARLLNAMWFGVPQSRERMIFIGVRNDLGIEPSHPVATMQPEQAGRAIENVAIDETEKAFLLAAGSKYAAYKHWDQMVPGQSVDDITGGSGFSGYKVDPYRVMQTIKKNDGIISMHGSMHWAERRRFALVEFKRFASYPRGFHFTDWINGVQRIGNSVPPLFMRAIAQHIRREILSKAVEYA